MDNNNYSNGDYTAPEFGSGSGDGSDNSQYNTSGQYTSGQYNANDQYGTSGQYNANAQYNTNGQYGADNQYNMNGQYYTNGQYNQAGQYNMNGQQYQYNNGYGQGPVDNNGRPIPNNFGMKLTFSILVTIFLSKIFGILSIVFNCLQNKAYKEGRWDDFKNKRKLSNVFLWIGLILGIIMFVVSIVFAGAIFKEVYNAVSDYDYDYDYDYDDSDDSDYDFDYDDASDTDSESDYVYGSSTFDFDAVEDMTINGAAVSVPMAVTDFIAATGYDTYIDIDLDSYDLSGHNGGEFAYIDDENGCSLIDIYNGSDDEAKAIDGTIGGIKLDFEDTSAPIQFEYRGITNDSSIDDVLDVFGEADTRYNGEYSTELTYYTTNGWIEFDWDTDGEMISIWLENYEEID